jgi:hypothetical protein
VPHRQHFGKLVRGWDRKMTWTIICRVSVGVRKRLTVCGGRNASGTGDGKPKVRKRGVKCFINLVPPNSESLRVSQGYLVGAKAWVYALYSSRCYWK